HVSRSWTPRVRTRAAAWSRPRSEFGHAQRLIERGNFPLVTFAVNCGTATFCLGRSRWSPGHAAELWVCWRMPRILLACLLAACLSAIVPAQTPATAPPAQAQGRAVRRGPAAPRAP